MHARRFRTSAFAERDRIGGTRKKKGRRRPRAILRREVHAAREIQEAQRGEHGLHQALHCGLDLGDLRQLGSGILEVAQELLVGLEGFGFLASLFQDLPQIKLRQ